MLYLEATVAASDINANQNTHNLESVNLQNGTENRVVYNFLTCTLSKCRAKWEKFLFDIPVSIPAHRVLKELEIMYTHILYSVLLYHLRALVNE